MVLDILKAQKQKVKERKKDIDVYSGAYYTLGGVIAGFIFHDMWHKMELPGDKIEYSLITHQKIDNAKGIGYDKFIVTMLATGLMFAELFGWKGAAGSGGGLLLGYTYASTSQQGQYIGTV